MQKKQYERPMIVKHIAGLSNKVGRAKTSKSMQSISGINIKELTAKYGSPLFVFCEKTIREIYKNALRSFSVRYPKVQFAWSYKTNYLDSICKIYHDEGSWAEVVSEYEYEMAIRNGVPGNKIIYNGPYKPYESLKRAVNDDAMIHIDHFDEMYMLEQLSEELGHPIDVAIRINMDTGIYPIWNRFGFNLENHEAMNVVRRMHLGKKLNLVGIHSHIGTFILEPSAYKTETAKLVEFAKTVEQELGYTLKYIDIGGGFPSVNTLHDQYAPGAETNKPVEVYAEAITCALLEANFAPERLPTLILETVRALIDEAGSLITSVVANKRLPNGTRMVIIDAGVSTLFTAFWYKHEIMLGEDKEGLLEVTSIYGPLCMNIDVIRPSIRLPAMTVGDKLIIKPAGAYNVTQWMQFIHMRPAIVLIGENGKVDCIRNAETVDTVKGPEMTPDWLNS